MFKIDPEKMNKVIEELKKRNQKIELTDKEIEAERISLMSDLFESLLYWLGLY